MGSQARDRGTAPYRDAGPSPPRRAPIGPRRFGWLRSFAVVAARSTIAVLFVRGLFALSFDAQLVAARVDAWCAAIAVVTAVLFAHETDPGDRVRRAKKRASAALRRDGVRAATACFERALRSKRARWLWTERQHRAALRFRAWLHCFNDSYEGFAALMPRRAREAAVTAALDAFVDGDAPAWRSACALLLDRGARWSSFAWLVALGRMKGWDVARVDPRFLRYFADDDALDRAVHEAIFEELARVEARLKKRRSWRARFEPREVLAFHVSLLWCTRRGHSVAFERVRSRIQLELVAWSRC